MHSYDKRFNYGKGRVSLYESDIAPIVRAIKAGEVDGSIAEGYGDWNYVGPGGETLQVIRRTDRVFTQEEFLATFDGPFSRTAYAVTGNTEGTVLAYVREDGIIFEGPGDHREFLSLNEIERRSPGATPEGFLRSIDYVAPNEKEEARV